MFYGLLEEDLWTLRGERARPMLTSHSEKAGYIILSLSDSLTRDLGKFKLLQLPVHRFLSPAHSPT